MKRSTLSILVASILIVFPWSIQAAPSPSGDHSAFPRFSLGIGGLGFRLEDKYLREVIAEKDHGLIFGYQLDLELRVLSTDHAAIYLLANLTQPSKDMKITETLDGKETEHYTITQAFEFRSVGTRFSIRGTGNSRVWIDGGAAYLRWTTSTTPSNIFANTRHVHGWFVGLGFAKPLIPHVSFYTRMAFISTPQYSQYVYPYQLVSTRTEYGGWNGAAGLRIEL